MLIKHARLPLTKRGDRLLAAVYLRKVRRRLAPHLRRKVSHVRYAAAALMRRDAREEWSADAFASTFLAEIAEVMENAPLWANPVSFSEFQLKELSTDGRLPE
jgi:hypothetical protein